MTKTKTNGKATSVEVNEELDMKKDNGVQLKKMSNETEKSVPLPPLPGNRPIDASTLEVINNLSPNEKRPIVSSKMGVYQKFMVSGNRPVAHSEIKFDKERMIMGNRPIASNKIDEDDLMGYLD